MSERVEIDYYPQSAIERFCSDLLNKTESLKDKTVYLKFSPEEKYRFLKDLEYYAQLFTPLKSCKRMYSLEMDFPYRYGDIKEFMGPNNIKIIFENESDNS